jgi:telomerase reverse transcriptase
LDELGCSLFSVSDIYPKLKEFQARLWTTGNAERPLYFAKVDVQACFDTIPQQAVLRVVKDLLNTEQYLVQGEAHVKPPEPVTLQKGVQGVRPVVKFTSTAKPMDHKVVDTGQANVTNAVGNAILVAPLRQQTHDQSHISSMLTEHVEFNLIKIGKKFYRQKNGIPQGSVLSSLLCNFFYGKLEKHELSFLQGRQDTLLLRLIDDFLLITAGKALAERFLRIMHAGLPEYGVEVKPAKSLVNFECVVNGHAVLQAEGPAFPYCGLAIDTSSLTISKSGQTRGGTVADSLTVEYSNVPGRTFRRKALK